MSGFSKALFVVLTLALSATFAEAASRKVDLTRRQSEIGEKKVPIKTKELKMNKEIADQKIPIKEWHGRFSSIGQRRAPIEVRETNRKKEIRPDIVEMKKVDMKMAPESGRIAYVRNFSKVRDKDLLPKYRDADVVTVKEMSVPALSNPQDPLSMRDFNRFSFQRNHSGAGGADVQSAGSGEEK